MAKILLYLILGIGIGIHFWVGINQPLFGDEANTIFMARDHSYVSLLTRQVEKIHPNGSLILTKLMWDSGLGITGLRLVNSLLFSLTLWPIYQIFKSLQLSSNQALIGTIVWSLAPYILLQSYLIRPYAYGIFFLTCSLYFALKNNSKYSLIFDLLGVGFVSGYWIYVLAKYLVSGKKRSIIIMATALIINVYTASQVNRAVSTHLDWMPLVKLPDLLSMTTTLLGLTSPAYYEGYSSTPSSLFLTVGLTLLIVILVSLYQSQPTEPEKYLLHLARLIFLGYVSVWVLGFIFRLPVFHVRQLFPVAVVTTIMLTYIAIKNLQTHKLLTLLLILPLLLLSGKRTIDYTLHPIYPAQMIVK